MRTNRRHGNQMNNRNIKYLDVAINVDDDADNDDNEMNSDYARNFLHNILTEFAALSHDVIPAMLSSLILSIAVSQTKEPEKAIAELFEHVNESLPNALAAREKVMAEWKRSQN